MQPLQQPRPWVLIGLLIALVLASLWWLNQPAQVVGYRLEPRDLQQRVIASGTVTSDVISQIGSEITGTVKARHVREGDVVSPGQLLLELNDEQEQALLDQAQSALTEALDNQRPQAQARLNEARANRQQAQAELSRREVLFAKGLFAQEQLAQAEQKLTSAITTERNAELTLSALEDNGSRLAGLRAQYQQAQAQQAKTQIRAPRAGTILTRNVEPGDQVQAGRTLLTMAHADRLEIIVPVDEKLIAPLTLGQPAQVIADAYPERVIQARIRLLAPNIDTSRGSLDVRLALSEEANFLRQGMTVTADIHTQRQAQALVISHDAVFEQQSNQAVAVVVVDGKTQHQPIILGLQGQTLSTVQQGLTPGAIVLTQFLAEGQKVDVQLIELPLEAR